MCNAHVLHLRSEVLIGDEVMNNKLKPSIQEVKSSDVELVTQDASNSSTQLPLPSQQIKSLSSITFSQKFYQSHAIAIAEEYNQAIDANCLETINILFNKVLDLNEN